MNAPIDPNEVPSAAWYRHPMVWLMLTPPVGAVIAGVITMMLILKHPDPVLSTQAVLEHKVSTSVMPPAD
jgi:hypothetical protein